MTTVSTRASRPGQPGGARDQNRKRRLADLGRAACKLYLGRGLDAVAVEDIAAAARLSKAGFYRYHADQEALVDAMIRPLHARFRAAMIGCERALVAAPDAAALPAIYLALAAELWQAVPGLEPVVLLYLQECRLPPVGPRRPIAALAREVERRAVRITQVARDRGLPRDLDPTVVALIVIGAVERILYAALRGREPGPPAEVARTLISAVVDGIRSRPAAG